ncbi:hypothetical protein BT69DRAFT_271083 [Atractiella rhizophila]|nr:hypothetical protein BT69DRAFT_271083 [Atractiella rhizophila]
MSSRVERIDGLVKLICLMLRSGTASADTIEVPIGHIVTSATALIERTKLMKGEYIYIGHSFAIAAARLLAQTAASLGKYLGTDLERILNTVEAAINDCSPHSPIRSTLLASYSIVMKHSVIYDPDFAAKGYARIVRSLVDEIGSVMSEDMESKGVTKSLTLEVQSSALSESRVRSANAALSTLNRLLGHPISHFLPGPVLSLVFRTLLVCSTRPQLSEISDATPSLVYACLLTIVKVGGEEWVGTKPGLLEQVMHAFHLAQSSASLELANLGREGMNLCMTIIHPRLPPFVPSHAVLLAEESRVGGPLHTEPIHYTNGSVVAAPPAEEAPPQDQQMEIDEDSLPKPTSAIVHPVSPILQHAVEPVRHTPVLSVQQLPSHAPSTIPQDSAVAEVVPSFVQQDENVAINAGDPTAMEQDEESSDDDSPIPSIIVD